MILANKNTFIKKIKFVFFIILFSLLFLSFVKADVISPTSEFYVNDYASVLSEETKTHIINTNIELEKKTGAQVVVVTINSLDGQSLETYSTKLFREFGIGDKEKNNGLLILLVVNDRKSRIEVGYGLEGALPDGKTGRIQDEYMLPYYSNNDWDSGIKNGFDACLSVIMNEYNIEIEDANYIEMSDDDEFEAIIDIILVIIVISIIILTIISKGGHGGGFYTGGFYSSGSSGGHSSFGGFSGGGGRSGGGRKFQKFLIYFKSRIISRFKVNFLIIY